MVSDLAESEQNAALLALCLAAGLLVISTSAAGQSKDDEKSLERQRSTVWQSVDRLAEEYREPWHDGVGQVLSGGFLIWAGSRQLADYGNSGSSASRPFQFPWFGLLFTVSGSSSVAAGIHRMVTSNPEADHARRLANSDLSERAGLTYLRYRADDARRARIRDGVTQIASGVGGATYVFLVPIHSDGPRTTVLLAGSAVAAITVGFGIYRLASKSLEEKLYDRATQGVETSALRPRLLPAVGPAHTKPRTGPPQTGVEAGLQLEFDW